MQLRSLGAGRRGALLARRRLGRRLWAFRSLALAAFLAWAWQTMARAATAGATPPITAAQAAAGGEAVTAAVCASSAASHAL